MDARERAIREHPVIVDMLAKDVNTVTELDAWYRKCVKLIGRVQIENKSVLSKVLMEAFGTKAAQLRDRT